MPSDGWTFLRRRRGAYAALWARQQTARLWSVFAYHVTCPRSVTYRSRDRKWAGHAPVRLSLSAGVMCSHRGAARAPRLPMRGHRAPVADQKRKSAQLCSGAKLGTFRSGECFIHYCRRCYSERWSAGRRRFGHLAVRWAVAPGQVRCGFPQRAHGQGSVMCGAAGPGGQPRPRNTHP